MFFNSMRHIYRARPVDLLKSRRAGEKEPKAKWILAVIGGDLPGRWILSR